MKYPQTHYHTVAASLWITALSITFAFVTPAMAQGDLRIGEWSSHLSFNGGTTLTQSDTRIYYGAGYGVMSILKSDTSQAMFFSKVEGLSDAQPSWIKYHKARETLIIAYINGNIDLVDSTGVTNINDLKRNNTIQGDKRISRIYVDDTEVAYLCTPFGLLLLNMETGRFNSTVFTPSPTRGFVKFQDAYYLATQDGLFRYDPGSGNIIEDFSKWVKLDVTGMAYTCQDIGVFEGKLYAGIDGELFRLDDTEWIPVHGYDGYTLGFISTEGSSLMAGYDCDSDCLGKMAFYDANGFTHEAGPLCIGLPTYAIEDERGRLWYADEFREFRMAQNKYAQCDYVQFNVPFSSLVSDMVVEDGKLYVATGGASESYSYQSIRDGFFVFDRARWEIYNQFTTPAIEATELFNFFRILPDPLSDRVYVGTYWQGLLQQDGTSYTVFNDTNSSIQGASGDNEHERVTGMAFDRQGNLWLSNYFVERPLSVMKRDGTWKSFDFPCSNVNTPSQIVIDERGYKWIMIYSTVASLIVYDDKGTIDDASDDRCIQLSASNTEIPSNSVYSLAVDLEGDIWVGTAQGPVVFDGAGDVFNGHRGSRIKVDQDDVLNYLLGEETIYTIAVDGANRKWFGTGSGVFVQSPAGDEEVVSYDINNSPLLDNRIVDIAIDQNNGIVYIATPGGILSVRTDAVAGRSVHDDNVYAFPNPVRPDYEGPIAIRGLARDAVVKITDIRGEIVYETRALGGQAIWDGRDLKGRKAETGVYLVFSTSGSDGFLKPDAVATKILVVN